MNKKIVAIVLVIALALTSAFAATTGTSKKGDVSVGAGIGTGVEVVARYGMGKFDLQGGVSLDFLSGNSFAINGGAFYNFADWTFKTGTLAAPQKISFTTGPLAKVLVIKDGLGLGLLWAAGAEYTFPKVPVTIFLNVGLGINLKFNDSGVGTSLAGHGILGGLYTF